MKLCFFRSASNIPVEAVEEVAERVGRVFGVDYFVFTGPILCSVEEVSIEDLLSISDRFLERGEPIVAIVYTREKVEDYAIYGLSSEASRGAWVWWNDRIEQIVTVTIHELGHICEADHCDNEYCVMYPIYREHKATRMDRLFCGKCLAVVQSSWVYNRLTQASKDRARKGGSRSGLVHTAAVQISPSPLNMSHRTWSLPPPEQSNPYPSTFPEWPSWPLTNAEKEEFIRRVLEYFGYEEDE